MTRKQRIEELNSNLMLLCWVLLVFHGADKYLQIQLEKKGHSQLVKSANSWRFGVN